MKQIEIDNAINAQREIILSRMSSLQQTDYIAAKIAEGKATKTEYRSKIDERQGWRDEINAAQSEIDRLSALEPDPEINDFAE